MRRSFLYLLVPVVPFAVAGCEDGPDQTFSPATGSAWNSGGTQAAADDAGTPLDGGFGGSNKQQICSGQELQAQWSGMVQDPIMPPRFMGGLDLAGGDKFPGLTVEQAEQGPLTPLKPQNWPKFARLCQGQSLGAGGNGGDVGGSLVTAWGNNSEMTMEWAVPTHKAYVTTLNPGYVGTMEWDWTCDTISHCPTMGSAAFPGSPMPDGKSHHYVWQIGHPVTKTDSTGTAKEFQIDWDLQAAVGAPAGGKLDLEIDELYKGIVHQFAPDIFQDTKTTCNVNGTCLIALIGNQDGTGRTVIGFRPAAFYFQTYTPYAPQPSGSTQAASYSFNVKYAPYSVSTSTMTLNLNPLSTARDGANAYGPSSFNPDLGDLNKFCLLQLSDTFGNLLDNCINVYSNPDTDTLALNKTLGNMTHDDQNFAFSVVGINQNYRPSGFDSYFPFKSGNPNQNAPSQYVVIGDTDTPQRDALASDFQSDVRTYGPILNDAFFSLDSNNNIIAGKDFHGSGTVFREWGRMVQQILANDYVTVHGGAGTSTCDSGYTGAKQCTPLPKAWHDASCQFPTGSAPNGLPLGFNVNAWRPAPGCTGFEGFLTNAMPGPWAGNGLTTANDPWDVGDYPTPTGTAGGPGFLQGFEGGVKPGGPSGYFCDDAPTGQYNFCGFNGDLNGVGSDLLGAGYTRVLQFMGNGNILNVPNDGRDLRFFWKYFAVAYAKYVLSPASTDVGQNGDPTGMTLGTPGTGTVAPLIVRDYSGVAGVPWIGGGMCKDASSSPTVNALTPCVDTDYFIFDSFGGGAARSEFVSLDFADATHDPTDMEMKTLLVGTNLQAINFYRKLDREERAIFIALSTDKTQPAWAYERDANGHPLIDEFGFKRVNANVFLSNIAGSPALSNAVNAATGGGWTTPVDASGNPIPAPNPANGQPLIDPCNFGLPANMVVKTGNYCATHIDADCAGAQLPTGGFAGFQAPNTPVSPAVACTTNAQCTGGAVCDLWNGWCTNIITRENGKPLLEGYCSPFNSTPFNLAGGGATSGISIVSIYPLIDSAKVTIANYANPYAPTAAEMMTPPTLSVLVPYQPFQEGVGYPVASSGTNDIFVETAQLDFTGQVITPVFDILYPGTKNASGQTIPGTTNPGVTSPTAPQPVQIMAIETQDYLGDVFLCHDPVTAADRNGLGFSPQGNPGDLLYAHMYTSVEDILT